MRILAKPIRVIASFFPGKYPIPYKFKTEEGGERIEVKIDKILMIEPKMQAGIESIVYTCQSCIRGENKRYDLKYIKGNCQWELYRV